MARLGLSPSEAGERLGLTRGAATKLLYGDRGAGVSVAEKALSHFDVDVSLWGRRPARPWVPPGARAA